MKSSMDEIPERGSAVKANMYNESDNVPAWYKTLKQKQRIWRAL